MWKLIQPYNNLLCRKLFFLVLFSDSQRLFTWGMFTFTSLGHHAKYIYEKDDKGNHAREGKRGQNLNQLEGSQTQQKKKASKPFPHYSHLKNLIIISLNPRQNKPKSNQTLVLLPSNVIMTPILCYMLATRIASIKNNAISKKQIFF